MKKIKMNFNKNANKNVENLMKENINVENKNEEEMLIDEENIVDILIKKYIKNLWRKIIYMDRIIIKMKLLNPY